MNLREQLKIADNSTSLTSNMRLLYRFNLLQGYIPSVIKYHCDDYLYIPAYSPTSYADKIYAQALIATITHTNNADDLLMHLKEDYNILL